MRRVQRLGMESASCLNGGPHFVLPPVDMKTKIQSLLRLFCQICLVALMAWGANAELIPPERVTDWTQVGVRGGIPTRTNLIDVTRSPYNADNTGQADATAAIQNAINAATSGQVVYLPDGKYLIRGSLSLVKASNITLRGNTNSTLICVGNGGSAITIGSPGSLNNITDYIASGATNSSTKITLSSAPSFSVGALITISQHDVNMGTASFPLMNVHQHDYNIQQQVIVTAISGNVVTVSDPLFWNFTNAPVVMACVGGYSKNVGLENLIFTCTNSMTGELGKYSFLLTFVNAYDCWTTNCSFLYGYAYTVFTMYCSHLSFSHNTIRYSQGSGSNHAGLLSQNTGGSLFADNIFADGLQPGIEFNGGFCGNAVFANYFTNNIIGIDNHGPHPVMNLWEANVLAGNGGYFEMDGYFGSASHQTLLRNVVGAPYIPLLFKRWTTYMNVVGNVLGDSASGYSQYTSEANNPVGSMIVQFGYPNIGNNSYTASSPLPWNYPLGSYPSMDGAGQVYPSPICTINSDQGPTTTLSGNFSSISSTIASLGGSVYTLIFQDNVNTNLYYPTNGQAVYAKAAGTSTGVTLNTPVTVKAGWKVFIVGQSSWQQLQLNDKLTHVFTGNYDYFHKSVTWDANGAQTIPTSLVYPNGAPSWWGDRRWPAIDPAASPMAIMIPAEERYLLGTSSSTTGATNTPVSPPSNLRLIASSPTSNSPVTDGLVGWWKFLETAGNAASDSSGNGNTGTTVGSPIWQNPGLFLNGSSQYVAVSRTSGLPLYGTEASHSVTVSLWVYLKGANSGQVLYSEGSSGGTGRFLLDYNNSANPGKMTIWLPSTCSPARLMGNTTLSLNAWYHLVWTDNNGAAQLYINGSPDTASFNYTPATSGATSGVGIGAFYDGQSGDTYGFSAAIISDVRLWNKSLNASDVMSLYNGGRAVQ